MRNWMLLLLGAAACGKASAVPANVKEAKQALVTDAERERMEDSTKAWVQMCATKWEQGDSATLMGVYPTTGPLVSVSNGELYTSRDSIAHFLTGVTRLTDRKAGFQIHHIDVPAPGVAAVVLSYRYESTNPEKKHLVDRGVYTAVLVERDGHLQLIQEHQSASPDSKKDSGAAMAIDSVDAAFLAAYNRDDAAAIAALHTDNIFFVNGGKVEEGRAKLEEGWKRELPDLSDLHISVLDRTISGDLAAQTIRFTQQYRNGGKTITDSGYAVSVLRRGADGQWRYHTHAVSRAHK
jgi:uncharacterized protein (TIGR02246 family)